MASSLLQHLPLIRKYPPRFATWNGVAFAWQTTNQERAYGTLLEDAAPFATSFQVRLKAALRAHTIRLERISSLLTDRIARFAPVSRNEVTRLTRIANDDLFRAREIFRTYRTQVSVVASQHSTQARAVALAARSAGCATLYVPHAPVSSARVYADLPFDYAALRGRREVDYYTALGADPDRLMVAGHLALRVSEYDPTFPRNEIVVAPSPWGKREVEHFMRTVESAVDIPYIVCPHPRSDVSHLRKILPRRARVVHDRRTADVIADCARVVVQRSSGVAQEAMLMGIPVIEVTNGCGLGALYPVISEPHAYFVEGSQDLKRSLDSLPLHENPQRARNRAAWAREWCAHTVPESEHRLRDLLSTELSVREPLIDSWPTPNQH